jgi:hypothetical protein
VKGFLLLVTGIVVVAGAYFAGIWPERQRVREAELQVRALQHELSQAEARARLGQILGQLLRVAEAVEEHNYGDAAAEASAYFDRVAMELQAADRPDVKEVLEEIRLTRDLITTGLAKTEASTVLETLRRQQAELRRALGYN